jgi:hypothetical protein
MMLVVAPCCMGTSGWAENVLGQLTPGEHVVMDGFICWLCRLQLRCIITASLQH